MDLLSHKVPRPTVLAIDPGVDKCGLAVLAADRKVLYQAVVPVGELAENVVRLREGFEITHLGIGDRTGARQVEEILTEACPDLALCRISEDMTSLMARRRYWTDHPLRGLQRLIPLSLRLPPRPVDDYAAVILAERLLAQKGL